MRALLYNTGDGLPCAHIQDLHSFASTRTRELNTLLYPYVVERHCGTHCLSQTRSGLIFPFTPRLEVGSCCEANAAWI